MHHLWGMTTHTSSNVTIGTRNGIVWICYRDPDETDAQFEKKLTEMTAAFARS